MTTASTLATPEATAATPAAVAREAPHHTKLTCYTDYRCRRPECVRRYNDWQNNRLHAKATGTWQPLIDATPVREHLHKLHAVGITPHRVSVLTGIDWNTIRLYTQPAPKQGRGMFRRTTPEFEAKILAIQPEPTLSGLVDPTGTCRRIQALSAIGWPLKELGPHIGVRPDNVRRLLKGRQPRVQGTTAQGAIDAYAQLRNDHPSKHGVSAIGISRALRNAKQHRWAPPKYWDQYPGAIDDPHFIPEYRKPRIAVVAEEAHWLMTAGRLTRADAADRLGITKSYIERAFKAYPEYAVEVAP
ncbi:hypothetical protein ACFZB5_13875 [Streptomyces nodosus]|uniref:hypothetical protein n=1 Tax=Streptomyces nodosus TaxID=40318 RepID=UPI0036E5A0FD